MHRHMRSLFGIAVPVTIMFKEGNSTFPYRHNFMPTWEELNEIVEREVPNMDAEDFVLKVNNSELNSKTWGDHHENTSITITVSNFVFYLQPVFSTIVVNSVELVCV